MHLDHLVLADIRVSLLPARARCMCSCTRVCVCVCALHLKRRHPHSHPHTTHMQARSTRARRRCSVLFGAMRHREIARRKGVDASRLPSSTGTAECSNDSQIFAKRSHRLTRQADGRTTKTCIDNPFNDDDDRHDDLVSTSEFSFYHRAHHATVLTITPVKIDRDDTQQASVTVS